jgi:hypothetical protein|tara:strand:- start:67 stop:465 length:399 start_codon:yes stop_codon:yes gene_type:complete
MPRQKVVNNIYIDLTPEEEAELDAQAEAYDLDMGQIRSQRDGQLSVSDWTQIGDATLGDHTAEEWRTYRQALRDLPSTYSRVSEVVWPEDPPTAKVTRKVTAGNAAKQTSLDDGGTIEEAQTAYDTAYAATD